MRHASAAPAVSTEPAPSIAPISAPASATKMVTPVRFPRPTPGEHIALALLAIWIVVQLLLLWPAPLVPAFDGAWRHDPAIFAYEGALVRQGGIPYLAFWDHKGPLIFLINAAGLSLSGGAIWGVWLVGVLAILIAAAIAYRTMRESFGVAGALSGLVFFVFALGGIETGTNMTEQYALPLAWASGLVFVHWTRTRRAPIATGLALGALGALAFLLRANLIGATISAAVTIAIVTMRERKLGTLARTVLGSVLGAVVIGVPIVAWLAHAGALTAFWDQAITYNLLYVKAGWGQRALAAIAGVWLATVTAPLLLPIGGLIFSVRRLRRSRLHDRSSVVALFVVIWTGVELALASVSGRAFDHYFMMLLPPMSMLTATLVVEVLSLAPANVRRHVRWTPMVATVLALLMFRPLAEQFVRRARGDGIMPSPAESQTVATARFVQTNSAPGDRLFVWGLAGGVYFLAHRPPATRYLFASPLLTRTYGDSIAQQFLAELQRSHPMLIVDATTTDPSAPPLAQWNPTWRYPDMSWYAPHRAMTASLRLFYDFVALNYTPVAVVGPERWTVYRANNRASAP